MLSPFPSAPARDNDEPVGSIADLIGLIRAEYDEMPGLTLTAAQACRLFGMDPPTANAVLRALIDAGVLVRTPAGAYRARRATM